MIIITLLRPIFVFLKTCVWLIILSLIIQALISIKSIDTFRLINNLIILLILNKIIRDSFFFSYIFPFILNNGRLTLFMMKIKIILRLLSLLIHLIIFPNILLMVHLNNLLRIMVTILFIGKIIFYYLKRRLFFICFKYLLWIVFEYLWAKCYL